MNPTTGDDTPSSLGSSWLRRAHVIEQFEDQWHERGEADIEEFVSEFPPGLSRIELLGELIKVDLECRWRRGEKVHIESYASRFPELGDRNTLPIDLISEEVRVRRLFRCPPTREELAERFPSRQLDLERLADGLEADARIGRGHESISGKLPRRLGQYEILEQIGSGGFSIVYRARDTELLREVAVKVPRADLMEDLGARARVLREAQTSARLRHPAIVPIHEVGQEGGTTFIVYEFVRGPTLTRLLADVSPSPQQAAEWVARLAEALEYAHENGIVHRDVKSANIMMDERGQPMLTDFGLALQSDAAATLTQHGDILGTPAYMSPEQARGEGHEVDASTDVYSLGVVLYELLCGQLPFQGSGASVLHKVIHDEPQSPRQFRTTVPLDLETICLKALAKEPARRYASAGAMAEDLRSYLEHRPIRARRVGPLGRLARWCRRRPAVAATITIATAISLAVAALSFRRVVTERDGARRISAALAFDRAQSLGEQGEAGQALLWFARSQELAPAGAIDLPAAARLNQAAWQPHVGRLTTLASHGGPLLAMHVSADGRIILTGGADKAARLRDATTGNPIGELLQHDDRVVAVAVSRDGAFAVTGCDNGDARVWDLATGQPIGSTMKHASPPSRVAISPDGRIVATGCGDRLWLWQSKTGKPIGEPLDHPIAIVAVGFNDDGQFALSASQDGTIWRRRVDPDGPDGEPIRLRSSIRVLTFDSDGQTAIVGYQDNSVWHVRLTGDEPTEVPLQQRGLVTCAAFSRDGRTILTGSSDRTARLWDAATRTPIGSPMRHPDGLLAVAFGEGNRTVVTGCIDGFVRLWEAPQGNAGIAGHVLEHDYPIWALDFSPDGTRLFAGGGWRAESGVAQLWDVATGKPAAAPIDLESQVMGLSVSPDGETLLTGTFERRAQLWNASTGRPIGDPILCGATLTLASFSPDGKRFMTGSFSDRNVCIWDTQTRQPILHIEHGEVVRSAVWSRDGRLVLTGGADGAAKLWEAATGRLVAPPMHQQGQVGAVALDGDNRFALVGTDADRAQLWDATTGSPIGPPLEHKGTVRGVAFSPDGKRMATASWDMTARLWDRATGKPIGPPLPHAAEVEAVGFSPDGQWLATAGWDKTVRLWRVPERLTGSPEHIRLQAEVQTGMELDPVGAMRLLPARTWQERNQVLSQAAR